MIVVKICKYQICFFLVIFIVMEEFDFLPKVFERKVTKKLLKLIKYYLLS